MIDIVIVWWYKVSNEGDLIMSSKKKKREMEWLNREKNRNLQKAFEKRRREAIESGDIEKMAGAFGLKLR